MAMRKLEGLNKTSLQYACKKETSNHKEFRFMYRLHCVLLVVQASSCNLVAEWFREHPCSFEHWVHYCNEHDLKELRDEQEMECLKDTR